MQVQSPFETLTKEQNMRGINVKHSQNFYERDLLEAFEQFGTIEKIIPKTPFGCKNVKKNATTWILFSNRSSAMLALEQANSLEQTCLKVYPLQRCEQKKDLRTIYIQTNSHTLDEIKEEFFKFGDCDIFKIDSAGKHRKIVYTSLYSAALASERCHPSYFATFDQLVFEDDKQKILDDAERLLESLKNPPRRNMSPEERIFREIIALITPKPHPLKIEQDS